MTAVQTDSELSEVHPKIKVVNLIYYKKQMEFVFSKKSHDKSMKIDQVFFYEFLSKINDHFYFLSKSGAKVVGFHSTNSFDNSFVIIETIDFRIRFLRERSSYSIELGTLNSPINWESTDWYDLVFVIMYLTQNEILITEYEKYRFDDNKQLAFLSAFFKYYYEKIANLFNPEVFKKEEKRFIEECKRLQLFIYEPSMIKRKEKLEENTKRKFRLIE